MQSSITLPLLVWNTCMHCKWSCTMASQPAAEVLLDYCEIHSFVQGAHAYQGHWQWRTEHMLNLQREPNNCRDKCAVAIIKADSTTVGHIPYNLALLISLFLARNGEIREKSQSRHWIWPWSPLCLLPVWIKKVHPTTWGDADETQREREITLARIS